MKKFIERVTEETRRETTERMLMESKGVQPERVGAGEILFTDDKEGAVWVATNWQFIPRHIVGGTHSKEKTKFAPSDNPEFIKAVGQVNLFIGPIDTNEAKTKSKGIILITLKDAKNKSILVGRHSPKAEEPPKIDNSEFSAAGFKRRTKAGSQLQTLTASHFLEKHTRIEPIRISDNNVPHYIFSSLEELKARILKNMRDSSYAILKDPAVLKATEDFFNGGAVQFDWSEVGEIMAPQDKAKFGIYLISELSYPFLIWGGKSIGNFPNFSTMTFFAVPTDNTNTSYDSYLRGVLKTGEIGNLKVSSKAMSSSSSKGARSSILPKLHSMGKNLTNLQVLSNKFLVAMLPYFKTSGRSGGQAIYPFMIKEVMKLKIQDPVKFWNDICKLHGKRQGKLTAQEMKDLERDVHLVQKFVQNNNGIPLVGLGIRAPLNQNAAKYIQPFQWKDFCKYMSDLFCDAITYGLNHDTSDFRPSISWQVTLNNMEFVRSGKAVFTVNQASANSGGMVFDNGKQSAGDPSRNITWLGVRPL